ncbi:unnamed protein product [Litomosoides sigmodontis]|uniref:C2H2-type domain-containing protein n=1 Tax=Litomosoides sigmodontis TaxID=42156 RepID=A0A3P6SLC1_LITSI|nr:unnamed protein product [Litomosoides sigmodontis]
MMDGRRNKSHRQVGGRSSQKPMQQINFGRSANGIPPRSSPIPPNQACQQAIPNSVRRALFGTTYPTPQTRMSASRSGSYADFSTHLRSETTGTIFVQSQTEMIVSTVSCHRRFYGYTEEVARNEPELCCSICGARVLKKFLEIHAWLHLSWSVQVGDQYPFQCTRCDFAAFRIPDVVAHARATHGCVGSSLFVTGVPDEVLQFFFEKVMECFPPTNYSNAY